MVGEVNAKNSNSQAESRKTHGRVGIITNRFDRDYYGYMVESASNYLMARGFQAIVQSNLSSRLGELEACSSLAEIDCDGLIIHADSLSDRELNSLFERHDKAVLLNRLLEQFPTRCVYSSNIKGGAIAAQHLLHQGHEHIAMVNGPSRFFEARERATGFTDTLNAAGMELSLDLEGDFRQQSGMQAMESILNSKLPITAVFFHNDNMAIGAMNTCRLRGVNIPERISLIGYDGNPMCDYVTPKLTSIQQPLRNIGERAAGLVCDLILDTKDASADTNATSYDPVLAERESVGPPQGYLSDKVVLTDRETECLVWTARGKTAWEISVILGISESTATFHLRNAGTKLQASNRTHTVVLAMQLDLIKP